MRWNILYLRLSPYIKPPCQRYEFHEFRSIGERSRTRENSGRNESREKPFNASDTRKAARRNVASWWRVGGGERERERKKKHFPRACSISIQRTFFPRCHSILIDRGRVVFPFLRWKMRFPLTQIRQGAEEQNETTREKWGNATPTR